VTLDGKQTQQKSAWIESWTRFELTLEYIKRIGNDIFETKNEQEKKHSMFRILIHCNLYLLQVAIIRVLNSILYFYTLQMDEQMKNILEDAENDSNNDLDFFDAMDDMNTYLDSIDDYDDIDALCEWYLTFGF